MIKTGENVRDGQATVTSSVSSSDVACGGSRTSSGGSPTNLARGQGDAARPQDAPVARLPRRHPGCRRLLRRLPRGLARAGAALRTRAAPVPPARREPLHAPRWAARHRHPALPRNARASHGGGSPDRRPSIEIADCGGAKLVAARPDPGQHGGLRPSNILFDDRGEILPHRPRHPRCAPTLRAPRQRGAGGSALPAARFSDTAPAGSRASWVLGLGRRHLRAGDDAVARSRHEPAGASLAARRSRQGGPGRAQGSRSSSG